MYNAFISYSHAADDKFAPALQDALHKFAKPWYKKRNLEVFRDESSLSASPHLWSNITQALDEAEYLIILASPSSQKSKWVNREIEYWLEHRSIEKILIALTDGSITWDDQNKCFLNPENHSLPPALDNKFDSEPFYIDLRQSKTEQDLSLDNPIFKKEVLKLAAKLHNTTPNNLASEEVSVHRKMIRLRNGAISSLLVLLIAVVIAGLYANKRRREAETETKKAQSITLAAVAREQLNKNPTIAIRLAEQAWKISPDSQPSLAVQRIISEAFYGPPGINQLFYKYNLTGHSEALTQAVFSPDGKKIVTASIDETVKLWDAISGKKIADLASKFGSITNICFSPDGERIVTTTYDNVRRSKDYTAKLWDAATGVKIPGVIDSTGSVISAAFSSDGKAVITVSSDGTVKLWDATSGKKIKNLARITLASWAPSAIFSPDGTKFISDFGNNKAQVWDAVSGNKIADLDSIADLKGQTSNVSYSIATAVFSRDGKKIFTSAAYSYSAKIWDATTGIKLHDLAGLERPVSSAAFSREGEKIVIAFDDTVRIWDFTSGKKIDLLGQTKGVFSAVFSPPGDLILTASYDSTARIWDAASGKKIADLTGHSGVLSSANFSRDGTQILTASSDHTARIWSIASGEKIAGLGKYGGDVLNSVFSPDGTKILVTPSSDDDTAQLWNAILRTKIANLKGRSAAFSPDGKQILTTANDSIARTWDAISGAELHELTRQVKPVSSAFFSRDGTRILAVFNDSGRIWDATSGKEITTFIGQSKFGAPSEMIFSPDGRQIFTSASDDSIFTIRDAVSQRKIVYLKGRRGEGYGPLFSSNGKQILAAFRDSSVRLWDAVSGKKIKDLLGHTGLVTAIFSPDGKLIFSTATYDRVPKLWDATSGKLIKDLKGQGCAGTKVVFSPDGKLLLTICPADYTVKIWNAAGKNIYDLVDHPEKVSYAAFSSDGKQIVTICGDKTVMIWESSSGKQIADLRDHTGSLNSAVFSPDGKQILTSTSNDSTARIWLTPKGIMDWLQTRNGSIYRLTQKDMEDLGIDFIDLGKINQ